MFLINKRDHKSNRKEPKSSIIRTSFLIIEKDNEGASEIRSTMMDNQEVEFLQLKPTIFIPENLNKGRRKPRICLYFSWLIGCDTALLIGSLLNYSIPTAFDLYEAIYAYSVPIW
uniref:Uncharacterized protein n=1 Tax=Acrobeloides nanus TaxID=290746 RepID=A0A914BZ73_9BILA